MAAEEEGGRHQGAVLVFKATAVAEAELLEERRQWILDYCQEMFSV